MSVIGLFQRDIERRATPIDERDGSEKYVGRGTDGEQTVGRYPSRQGVRTGTERAAMMGIEPSGPCGEHGRVVIGGPHTRNHLQCFRS
ncbi:MAG: hypothetical protein ACI9YT_000665 [Halobacteriales archaeon]|jgi:hypothetical protein